MKTIIISEEMERKIFQHYISEAISEGDIRLEVIKYLKDNYLPADKTILNKDGEQESAPLVIWLDKTTKQPFKTITLEKLFWKIQDVFQNIKDDKKERDEFLWDTIKAWYSNTYNPNTGNLIK